MPRHFLTTLAAVSVLVCTLFYPEGARAATRTLTVGHHVTPDSTTTFLTIQDAVQYAKTQRAIPSNQDSFIVKVLADSVAYPGFAAESFVSVIGSSTADTFLSPSGSGPTVTLSGVTNVDIRNFTFLPATTGIKVENSTTVNITNNVFAVEATGTGVDVSSSTFTNIVNNTFYRNKTAVHTTSDLVISNNIFSSNGTAIQSQGSLSTVNVTYNDYFNNTNNGITISDTANSIFSGNPRGLNPDPLFVDPGNRDFHLQSGSAAIGNGNPTYPNSFDVSSSDLGAYGGPHSDFPLPTVTGVTAVLNGTTSIDVSWNPVTDSRVKAYRVYVGTASRTYDTSPRLVPFGTNTFSFTDLDLTTGAPVPARPVIARIDPANGALLVSWSPVPNATSYIIVATPTDSSPVPLPITVQGGSVSSTIISGLVNGTTYNVTVQAVAQKSYFFAVTSVADSTIAPAQGSTNESPFSTEKIVAIGDRQESLLSAPIPEKPEAPTPFPNLRSGCFIATAAYGFYSAPQVQALRLFRDRFLMTNAPGRLFVAWYYRHAPAGARYLNEHPAWKPPVRALLFPLVVFSLLITATVPAAKMMLALVASVALLFLYRRKVRVSFQGVR